LLFDNATEISSVEGFVSLIEPLDVDVDEFQTCIEEERYVDEVAADSADAQAYAVTGTPTFFINGVRIVGAQPTDTFRQVIDEQLGG